MGAEKKRDETIAHLAKEGAHDPNWLFPEVAKILMWRKANGRKQRVEASKSRWEKERAKQK